MPKWRTDFHRVPVEREEYRIKADFSEDDPELRRILAEANSQAGITGVPVVAHNNRRWFLISQSFELFRKRVVLELLRVEEP
jgi:hypothetical protein